MQPSNKSTVKNCNYSSSSQSITLSVAYSFGSLHGRDGKAKTSSINPGIRFENVELWSFCIKEQKIIFMME